MFARLFDWYCDRLSRRTLTRAADRIARIVQQIEEQR